MAESRRTCDAACCPGHAHVSAAPRMAAPHVAAPPPHMAVPHIAAPARNMAIPHGGGSHFAVGRGAPQHAAPQSRTDAADPSAADLRTIRDNGGPANIARRMRASQTGRRHPRADTRPWTGSREAGAERQQPAAAEASGGWSRRPSAAPRRARMTRARSSGRAPILRNPVFADQRAGRDAPSGQWTFRGRFAQSALHDDRPPSSPRRHRAGLCRAAVLALCL